MTFLNYLIFVAFNLEKKKSPGLGPRLRALQSQARALSPLKPSSKAGLFWAGSGWAGSGLGAQARPGTSLDPVTSTLEQGRVSGREWKPFAWCFLPVEVKFVLEEQESIERYRSSPCFDRQLQPTAPQFPVLQTSFPQLVQWVPHKLHDLTSPASLAIVEMCCLRTNYIVDVVGGKLCKPALVIAKIGGDTPMVDQLIHTGNTPVYFARDQ
ncbi:hypothetical protein F5890DRAFT_1479122 [Lentinula detonsa]|uniref:Uncharacterized protein n=1 Tax=Lentinula detonsa TaxID=2804962 RepID=A0AA38ULE9_9AGAR|nr:hypothetical protein F5890DRAFT_1479122 [Lentinula detonsa]